MEEMYARFNAWREKFQENIVDMGGQLGDGKVVTSEAVTDGPFVEAREIAGGFMIVSAQSRAVTPADSASISSVKAAAMRLSQSSSRRSGG